MHRRAIGIILASLLLATSTVAETDDNRITGSFGIALGVKGLDSGWEPLGNQIATVFSLTIGRKNWPVHIALDRVTAEDEETRVTGFSFTSIFIIFPCCFTTEVTAKSKTSEWDLGVRRVWRQDKKFRPYAGGGIAFIEGKISVIDQNLHAEDSTTGYWLNAGFRQPLGSRRVDWGFDLRYSDGTITLGGGEVDAGGAQALFYVGGRW